jgi:N6-adenosine-specific RNA methylase IME4
VKRITKGETQSVSQAQRLLVAERVRRRRSPWPTDKYDVLVIDPPWQYDSDRTPYPTMSLEEICALPVGDLAAEDAVLWLWTTNAMLRHAYTCLDAWGFAEKTVLTWDKGSKGATGSWLFNATEHAILAVRGQPTICLTTQTTVFRAPRTRHSEKPDEFYRLVERLCPSKARIDLFARKPRKGWAVWGDVSTEKIAWRPWG